MGREVMRVPMDFHFPLGESYADAHRQRAHAEHVKTCHEDDHFQCDVPLWEDSVPKGNGWQLWQTVSDGPTSPVFATADELIDWMCQPLPEASWPVWEPSPYPSNPWSQGWRRDIAEPFVMNHGRALSFVGTPQTGCVPGTEALVAGAK